MKKITLISLMSIAVVAIANTPIFSAIPAGAAPQPPSLNRAGSVARSRSDAGLPVLLPATITDPLLLSAWISIYQQRDVIQPGGSVAVSGRGLAQFVREQEIPVVWDADNVCRGGSCSVLHCGDERCTYADGRPGVAPIYIARGQGADLQSLTRTLAHEIFHRTQPFGPVRSTRYEEYWAFRVGVQIAQAEWPVFGQYDPLDPDHLNLWIRENRLDYYFQIPEYPAAVTAQVYRISAGGDPHSGIPAQAYATPQSR